MFSWQVVIELNVHDDGYLMPWELSLKACSCVQLIHLLHLVRVACCSHVHTTRCMGDPSSTSLLHLEILCSASALRWPSDYGNWQCLMFSPLNCNGVFTFVLPPNAQAGVACQQTSSLVTSPSVPVCSAWWLTLHSLVLSPYGRTLCNCVQATSVVIESS